MTSDRWAAVRREQRLLNPHLLLRDLVARPSLATTFPSTTLNGRRHRLLVINDPVSPIRLYVDARTGRVDRLSTADHQDLRRDVRLVVDFSDWRLVRGGTGRDRVRVRFPRTVSIRLDGKVIHTETRSSIAVNRPASAARFRFPAGIAPRYSATLAARGAATTEFLMSFAQDGFPKDGSADQIVARPVAPGSTLIQGIPNNSMIVEQSGGVVVVVEGALSDVRAEALIRYIQKTYPGKPIRYVTASHHHADHAGGMRPFVALGATAVIGADAVPLFRRVFSNRTRSCSPTAWTAPRARRRSTPSAPVAC
jgi:Metallo-beta-lactamase superfamily